MVLVGTPKVAQVESSAASKVAQSVPTKVAKVEESGRAAKVAKEKSSGAEREPLADAGSFDAFASVEPITSESGRDGAVIFRSGCLVGNHDLSPVDAGRSKTESFYYNRILIETSNT